MDEIIALLEKLGISIFEAAEPGLIAEAKKEGIVILNDIIGASEMKLKKLKVLAHLATVGHGKIVDEVKIGAIESEIILLKVAAKMLQA